MHWALLALCLSGEATPVHPDFTAFLEGFNQNDSNLLDLPPEQAQAMINAAPAAPVTIDIALVRDLTIDTPDGDLPARLYHPAPNVMLPLLVWYHGGGWVFGTLDMADPILRFIVDRAQIAVLSIDYRLAPQHPFPAAANDAVAAARWAIDHAEDLDADPRRLALGGDSAGGNLAAVAAIALRDEQVIPQPVAQYLVYGVFDTDLDRPSMHEFAQGYLLEREAMPWFLSAYLPDQSLRSDPRVAPIRTDDLSGLPHAVMIAAQCDILRDESVAYAAALGAAGVDVDLSIASGMIHGFIAMAGQSPAARSAFGVSIDRLADVMHQRTRTPLETLGMMLDVDGNGQVRPMEAADALRRLLLSTNLDTLPLHALPMLSAYADDRSRRDVQELLLELDVGEDGLLQVTELNDEFTPLGRRLDLDSDGILAPDELRPIVERPHDVFAHMEAEAILDQFGATEQGGIPVEDPDHHADDAAWLAELDADEDGIATREEVFNWIKGEDASMRFQVDGSRAHAQGTIDESTPWRVMELVTDHPQVRTIVMHDVPGSVDDDSCLMAARMIRQHGLGTHVPADGDIASGGVDFFLAGTTRTVTPGGRLGVHSWGGLGYAGADVDVDHEDHALYLDYYASMGIPEAFYWFTLNAAGPDDIHWMTQDELERFQCITEDTPVAPEADDPPVTSHDFGIEPLKPSSARVHRAGFTKYTEVVAPNSKPIRIIAQPGVPDIAVARARNLLRFFLTDVPGSRFGADKSAVANAMADNGAVLMMPEGHHRPGREPDIDAQPLFEDETPVDGSRWYVVNDWDHRDAAFEEIFHLVHDAGIGTWLPGALPTYQRELDREARAAITDGRWGIAVEPDVSEWLEELEEEDSLAQEYIASVIDTYYGLWAAFDERPGGMWGVYCAKTRDELDTMDPRGKALVEAFLPPMMHGYEALIDPSFTGTFWMTYDPTRAYTHKSRWYVDARLTGDADSGLHGNNADNTLQGNSGDNRLHGGGGADTAVFTGSRSEYRIDHDGPMTIVTDSRPDRDGTDRLIDIETIRFADAEVSLPSR